MLAAALAPPFGYGTCVWPRGAGVRGGQRACSALSFFCKETDGLHAEKRRRRAPPTPLSQLSTRAAWARAGKRAEREDAVRAGLA
jgi:hypothetical protein